MTATDDTSTGDTEGRNRFGRFTVGNRAGKGNPALVRLGMMQAAIRDAITAEDLRTVLMQLLTMARSGDVQAARLLLEHAVGRPREKPALAFVDIPALDSAAGIATAQRQILEAAANGEIDLEHATKLAGSLAQMAAGTTVPHWSDRPDFDPRFE